MKLDQVIDLLIQARKCRGDGQDEVYIIVEGEGAFRVRSIVVSLSEKRVMIRTMEDGRDVLVVPLMTQEEFEADKGA